MAKKKNRGGKPQKILILPIISIDHIHCTTYIHNQGITQHEYLDIVKYLESLGFTNTYFEHQPSPTFTDFDYLELVKHDL